jgi:hypothetical protein
MTGACISLSCCYHRSLHFLFKLGLAAESLKGHSSVVVDSLQQHAPLLGRRFTAALAMLMHARGFCVVNDHLMRRRGIAHIGERDSEFWRTAGRVAALGHYKTCVVQ